jgi:molybdate transport system substrate-binding protein
MPAPTLTVFSTHALAQVLEALQADFERAHGCRLAFTLDPTQAVRRRIENGEPFDVAVAIRGGLDALAAQGRIAPATIVAIASTGLGVSVRAGVPRPDIGSVEAFKRALLDANSVVRSREGASGAVFQRVLERLGIADAMRGKIMIAGSGRVAEFVARGEAELAVQQISELVPVKDADFVGPFPPELQQVSEFAAGVASASKASDLAEAFVALLAAPATAPLVKRSGLEPAVK